MPGKARPKAKSESQKRLAGMAIAYKKGEYEGKASEAVKGMAKMSMEDLESIAGTELKEEIQIRPIFQKIKKIVESKLS